MTMPLNVVLAPYPVSVGTGNCGWQKQRLMPPPPYPRERRDQWPLKTMGPPVRDERVRRMLDDARCWIAEDRRLRGPIRDEYVRLHWAIAHCRTSSYCTCIKEVGNGPSRQAGPHLEMRRSVHSVRGRQCPSHEGAALVPSQSLGDTAG
jgi:hypothetical protein